MYHDLKIYCSMLLSTIPKSPPKIIRENTYTDSKGSVFITDFGKSGVSEAKGTRPCEENGMSDNFS